MLIEGSGQQMTQTHLARPGDDHAAHSRGEDGDIIPDIGDRTSLKMVIAVLALFMAVIPASAFEGAIVITGVGNRSCTTWLETTPEQRALGDQWIVGFFSGANFVNRQTNTAPGTVGKSIDPEDILRAVQNECQAAPWVALARMTIRAFRKMQQSAK